jgi:cell division cycle protein 37
VEVLNPASTSSSEPSSSASTLTARAPDDNGDEDEDAEVPRMTPSLEEFAKLPLWSFEKLWLFIQNHREVVVPGASDALLVAAFRAQREGKSKYAKQCVHQSLVLQYGEKLGKDGVQLFFKRCVFFTSAHSFPFVLRKLCSTQHGGRR